MGAPREILVREATHRDAGTISHLNAAVQDLHAGALPEIFKPASEESFPAGIVRALMNDPNVRFYLALVDGAPAGYAYVEMRRQPETPDSHTYLRLYIHHISVDPQFHRLGVGTALMKAVVEQGQEAGADYLALSTWQFNQVAHKFFASQGFKPVLISMWRKLDG